MLPTYVQQQNYLTLAYQLIIIALFTLVTGLFFLWLQKTGIGGKYQILLLLGLFMGSSIVIALAELISIYPNFYDLGHSGFALLLFFCLSFFFDYASGIAAIILPTYFVDPQIRA